MSMQQFEEHDRKRKWTIAAEAVGLSHYIATTLCVILGETTHLFEVLQSQHTGLVFVYRFVDWPLAQVFSGMIQASFTDFWFAMVVGQMVIVLSSLLYAFATYLLFSVVLFVFVE